MKMFVVVELVMVDIAFFFVWNMPFFSLHICTGHPRSFMSH